MDERPKEEGREKKRRKRSERRQDDWMRYRGKRRRGDDNIKGRNKDVTRN